MKTISKIYKSEEILEMDDLYEIQEDVCSFGCPIQYQLTEGELGWLDFVRGRYSIADWVLDNLNEDNVLLFDDSFSDYLRGDGMECKAVCLSDETALQKLFFWCYSEGEE